MGSTVRRNRSAFTLIELLVVIAIIAILAVVVVLTLNPAQLLAQSRDANRVSDLQTLSNAISLYQTDQSGSASFSMGSSSVIYASTPDPTASSTCGTSGMLTPPSGYSWHCAASSAYKNASSSGWLPLNFNAISSGAPFGSVPADPTNQTSSRFFYTYTTNGSQFELTANMESQKYELGGSGDVISGDGASLITVYAKGTNLALEPLDYGDGSLVGYWPFNEGSGLTAYDQSGNGNNGTLTGTLPTWTTWNNNGALAFSGVSNSYVSVPSSTSLATYSAYTISMWVNIATSSQVGFFNRLGWLDSICGHALGASPTRFYIWPPGGSPQIGGVNGVQSVSNGTWHLITATVQGLTASLYLDGALDATATGSSAPSAFSGMRIGVGCGAAVSPMNGSMGPMRIYNRALSAAQIAALYSAGR